MERTFKITVDGRQYTVTVEDMTEGSSLIMPDQSSMSVPAGADAASAPAAAPAQSAAPASGPGDEVSPLAGVVNSIEVSVGQSVNEGDKVATIEAMKMKTAINAHRTGKVSAIHAKVGDAVDVGQPLLTIG